MFDVPATPVRPVRSDRGQAAPRRLTKRAVLTLAAATLALAAGACAGACTHSPAEAAVRLERALDAAVDGHPEVRSAVLRVDAPGLGIDFVHARGVAHDDVAFGAGTPFLSASVGKLFTAVTVLALVDDGRLALDAPLRTLIGDADLRGLPVTGGDDAVGAITVTQLLNHRSGLPDYFSESPTNDGAQTVLALMKDDVDRAWTRDQLLDYTRAHFDAAGAPGERFVYSDVNYDLLGLVIEGVTGRPFADVVRDTVIVPLGLTSTWYHRFHEPPAGLQVADAWIDDVNVGGAACLGVDGAGGGLATTTNDLRTFLRALVEGRPVSLADLDDDTTRDAIVGGIDYGRGLWTVRPGGLFFLLGGLPELQGASGATGSFAYYAAEHDAVITGTFNQTGYAEKHIEFLLADVLPTLQGTR